LIGHPSQPLLQRRLPPTPLPSPEELASTNSTMALSVPITFAAAQTIGSKSNFIVR
jgi:hypothetical protein